MNNELKVTVYDVILAALFHDIGKVGQRTGENEPEGSHYESRCPVNIQGGFSYNKHVKWTEHFLDEYPLHFDSQKYNNWQLITNLAASHHKESSFDPQELNWLVNILIEADRTASSWDRDAYIEMTNRNQMYTKPLYSIFGKLVDEGKRKTKHYLPLEEQGNAKWFPVKKSEELSLKEAYRKVYKSFKSDFGELLNSANKGSLDIVHFTNAVEDLLKKHFWNIPASVLEPTPTNSLFHHSRVTAMISALLFQGHQLNIEELKDHNEKKFLLIGGDLNGIQDYLYDLNPEHSSKVAKLLRSRSASIKLLCEMAMHLIIDKCNLTRQNILYEAGGKFAIVAVNTKETRKALEEAKQLIERDFLANFQGSLSLNINFDTAISLNDLRQDKFHKTLQNFYANLDRNKRKRFSTVLQEQGKWNPDQFCLGEDFIKHNKDRCYYCQRRTGKEELEGDEIVVTCRHCKKEIKLGEILPKTNIYSLSQTNNKSDESNLLTLGNIALKEVKDGTSLLSKHYYFKIRDDDEEFPHIPFKPVATYVPKYDSEDKAPMTLDEIARKSKGVDYCAVLKGDVDNLGKTFGKDILEDKGNGNYALSITTFNTLSSQVDLFFSTYLPKLIGENKEFRHIYVVYAGGDDFCLVGPWSATIKFAQTLNDKFKEFTTEALTFSAGIELMKKKSPIKHTIALTDTALDLAKKRENKNGLTLFETVLGWDEYSDQMNLGEEISRWVGQRSDDGKAQSLNSMFLRRLLTYYNMYEQTKQETCATHNYLYASYLNYDIQRNYNPRNKEQLPDLLRDYLNKAVGISSKKNTLDNFKVALTYAIYSNRKPSTQSNYDQ